MKLKLITLPFLSSAVSLLGQTTVPFIEDDFEAATSVFDGGNNSAVATITNSYPTAPDHGNVVSVDLGAGASQWGAMNTIPQTIDLPSGVEPGVSTYTMSMNVYVPTGTTFNGAAETSDRIGLIVRWNGPSGQDESTFQDFADFTPDTWVPFVHSGIIPAVAKDGLAPTKGYPIISFNDRNNDNAAGVAAYIDDYSFTVSVSEDDPNLVLGPLLGFGEIDQEGGPHTKNLVLENSGDTQVLTITSAALSGTNDTLFSFIGQTFPLDIPPGEERILQVSVDPGVELGDLLAQIDFVTNDPSTPNLTTLLSATSVEPFQGTEFIVNGDFETGDLTAWRDNDRFDTSTEFARSGTTSAVFNLAGGVQWGEARIQNPEYNMPDSISITPSMIGQEYFYSAWYLRPSTNGLGEEDVCRLIMRWNGINGASNHAHGIFTVGEVPEDTWFQVTGTDTIPEFDLDGNPVTFVTMLWSHQDVGSDGVLGQRSFIDDVSIKIVVPDVEPDGPPVITSVAHDLDNDIVTLTFTGTPNVSYALDRSTSLTDDVLNGGWEEIADGLVSADAEQTYQDFGAPGTAEKFFYRVREEVVVAP